MSLNKFVSRLGLLAVFVFLLTLSAGVMSAAAAGGSKEAKAGKDDLGDRLGAKQRKLRAEGLQLQLRGKIKPDAKVAKLPRGQYVQLAREGEDSIWTVLGEFGTQIDPNYGGTQGPLHNQIPQPDRSVDNTTIWTQDFSSGYYQNLLFSGVPGVVSMRNYWIEQSSNRYAVNGAVTDWGQVPYNEARYGTNACGSIVCSTVWRFVNDSVDDWYAKRITAGAQPGT